MNLVTQLRNTELAAIEKVNQALKDLNEVQQQLVDLGETPLALDNLPTYKTKTKVSNVQDLLTKNACYPITDRRFQKLFTTRASNIEFYLIGCVPTVDDKGFNIFNLTFRCKHHDNLHFDFQVKLFHHQIIDQSFKRLIKRQTDFNSLRFLRSILKNAREHKLELQYYYFAGSCIAINVTRVYIGCLAKPKTYWFDIQTMESLNRFEFMELQRYKAFPFIENVYGY